MANFGDGKLNSLGLPFCGTTYQGNSLVSSIRETALRRFNAEAFQHQGILRAICLRTDLTVNPPAGSWVQQSGVADKDKLWLTVYARIPELHAHITDPFAYGNEAGNAHLQINLHPAFISEAPVGLKDSSPIPAPGDIVEVDFGDRVNMTQPVYIGRVSEGTIKVPAGGAFNYFNNNRSSQGLSAATGDVRISSGIGTRVHPVSGEVRMHKGLDIAIAENTPIRSMLDGVVKSIKIDQKGYGLYVKIRHKDGRYSLYAHMNEVSVAPGQQVEQGQQIGLSGGARGNPNAGSSTGAHLHWEWRGGSNGKGEVFDPREYLSVVSN